MPALRCKSSIYIYIHVFIYMDKQTCALPRPPKYPKPWPLSQNQGSKGHCLGYLGGSGTWLHFLKWYALLEDAEHCAIDFKKLEHGTRRIYGSFVSSLGFGFRGQSYSNFLAYAVARGLCTDSSYASPIDNGEGSPLPGSDLWTCASDTSSPHRRRVRLGLACLVFGHRVSAEF